MFLREKNLKLIARTEEDLRVVSAHLQDSIVSVSDIASLKKSKIFLMQLNRFMWEDVEKGVFRKNKRIRTILKFENVIKVNSKNINQTKKDKFFTYNFSNDSARILKTDWWMDNAKPNTLEFVYKHETTTNTHSLGNVLYTDYIHLFQLSGMILLVAMIGAIVLTFRQREGLKRQSYIKQISREKKDGVELVTVKSREGIKIDV